jgi:hypothetical protein
VNQVRVHRKKTQNRLDSDRPSHGRTWRISHSTLQLICRSLSFWFWRADAPLPRTRSSSREIRQKHMGALLHSFEHNLTAIRGDVEVVNIEVSNKVG